MKRSLIAIAIATFATASHAGFSGTPQDGAMLDRSLPTYPELGYNDAYRFDAGEPTNPLTVQDYGSV